MDAMDDDVEQQVTPVTQYDHWVARAQTCLEMAYRFMSDPDTPGDPNTWAAIGQAYAQLATAAAQRIGSGLKRA